MCRSQAEGGRRCPGRHRAAGHTGDSAESYQGTPWQGYDEYMQRSAELDRRIANGENITDIMQAEKLARLTEQVEQIKREGW